MGQEVIEEIEMNTIEHEGQNYEVLTLGKQDGMTHVLFAGGELKIGETCAGLSYGFYAYDDESKTNGTCYLLKEAKLHNIQPLRLVLREPVTFEATFALSGSSWYPLHHLSDGLAHQNSTTKRFRCVEIVEEAQAILKAKGVKGDSPTFEKALEATIDKYGDALARLAGTQEADNDPD